MTTTPEEPLSDDDMSTAPAGDGGLGGGGDADGTDGGDSDGTDGGDADGTDGGGRRRHRRRRNRHAPTATHPDRSLSAQR